MTPEQEFGVCRNGHAWSPANTLYESSGRNGARRRRCRECRREKRQLAQVNAKRSTLDVSNLSTPRSRGGAQRQSSVGRANYEFSQALEHVTTHCNGKPEEFTDWDTDNPPTAAKATELCAPCPLLTLCREAAIERGEQWYIWGGLLFLDGKVVEDE